jgi:hypothetical protein
MLGMLPWQYPTFQADLLDLLLHIRLATKLSTRINELEPPWRISKTILRLGGMALSEWTPYVRAVRDTPVEDYFTSGVNTTHRVVYRPAISISLGLIVLSVYDFKRLFWHCGQLWKWVVLDLLGKWLHWDCNTIGDTANISTCVPSTCAKMQLTFY